MGLFTGMSILSVFELFMWLVRYLADRLVLPCCRRSKKKQSAAVEPSANSMRGVREVDINYLDA